MESESLGYKQEREIERLLALANLQRMRGQLTDAESTCRKILEINPSDVVVREMLGDILRDCGKLDQALQEYRSAMEMAPGRASLETRYAKTVLEIAEREREKAIAQDMIANPHKYTARQKSPVMAMLWAIVPGMGQFYNGDIMKAVVIWCVLLLFLISYALLQQPYPANIDSLQLFLTATNPFVLVLGLLFLLLYVYSLIDAPVMAEKSSKALKKQVEI